MAMTIEDLAKKIDSLKFDDFSEALMAFSNNISDINKSDGRMIKKYGSHDEADSRAFIEEQWNNMVDGLRNHKTSSTMRQLGDELGESFSSIWDSAMARVEKQFDATSAMKATGKRGQSQHYGGETAKAYATQREVQGRANYFADQLNGILKNAYSIAPTGNKAAHNASQNYRISSTDNQVYHGRNGYNVPKQLPQSKLQEIDNNFTNTQRQAATYVKDTARGIQRGTSGMASYRGARGVQSGSYNYVDFETVGKIGDKDFGITEMSAMNNETGRLETQFFQLS